MTRTTRFVLRRATSALVLLMFGAINVSAQMACADGVSAEEPKTYAVVDWPDPMNPKFVNLGDDRYLLSTSKGMQIWNARKNVFSIAKGWPRHSALRVDWSRLGGGTLTVAASHSDQDVLINTLVWWNPAIQDFSASLPLQPAIFIDELIEINEQHALVCMRTNYQRGVSVDTLPAKAAIIAITAGKLHWVTDTSANMHSALYKANVRGTVEGAGKLEEPASPGKISPVIFNTASCNWEMQRPPADIAAATDVTIKHHRLPDGRILIAQANWYSPARGVRDELAAPLLWDDVAGIWTPIENTAQDGGSPDIFKSYGIHDSVVSVTAVDAEFVEFLDPRNLRWTRSQQTLPKTYSPAVGPLSTGEAIVFLREGGRIILVNPLPEALPSRFVHRHPYLGEIKLAKGGLLLTGGGDHWHPANRPEILSLTPRPRAKTIAALPKQLGYVSGIELKDETILVFGGLPRGCSPSFNSDECGRLPQPSYRYFPKQDRWEEVPELGLRFASGQFWDVGNSIITSQWPRNDVLVRRNGDLIYLDGEVARNRQDSDLTPLVTTSVRWRAGSGSIPLARLRRGGRTYATLLELADGRVVVIGGQAQQEVVALEKQCFNCPDDFVSVGTLQWTRSTEVFDDKAGAWADGPIANYAGGQAFKLANGRIFKLSLTGVWTAENGYSAEISDAAFTRWKKLPPFPVKSFNIMHVTVSGNRVLILPQEPSRKTVVWNDDTRTWSVWNQWTKELPLTITPISNKRALARYYQSFEIVPMPE